MTALVLPLLASFIFWDFDFFSKNHPLAVCWFRIGSKVDSNHGWLIWGFLQLINYFLIWYFFRWKVITFEPRRCTTNIFGSEWLSQRFKKGILLIGSSKKFLNYLFLSSIPFRPDQNKQQIFRSTFVLSELFAGSCEQVKNILP